MKVADMKKWSTERLSTAVLYGLVALTVVVYGAFYLVGYAHPDEESPMFNAPLLTDVLLVFMVLLLLAAVGVIVWAVVKGWHHRDGDGKVLNGIPARRLSYAVAGGTAVVLLLTFLLGGTSPVSINGKPFAETFWLRAADMFVTSSIILILVAVGAVSYGYSKSARRKC